MRERRPGVWEVRIVVANDPVTGHSIQRSFTIRGSAADVQVRRRELVARFGVDRSALFCRGASWTVGELLHRFMAAEHGWRPATRVSHTSVVKFLVGDALGAMMLPSLGPYSMQARIGAWRAAVSSTV